MHEEAATRMLASEILTRVIAKLDRPEKLCSGWFARNARGEKTGSTSVDAVAWCVLGAITAVTPEGNQGHQERAAYDWIVRATQCVARNVAAWSDRSNHSEIMNALVNARDLALAAEAGS